jgi:hypothetical protein
MKANQIALLTAVATRKPDPKDMVGRKNKIPSGPDSLPVPGVSRLGFSGVMRALANKGLVTCYPGPSVSLTAKGLKTYRETLPAPAPAPTPAPVPKAKAAPAPKVKPAPAAGAELSPAQKAWVTRRAMAATKAAGTPTSK